MIAEESAPTPEEADAKVSASDVPKYVGKGGWRDGGRPKAAPGEERKPVSLRLTQSQLDKLDALGGLTWMLAKIESASAVPEAPNRRGDGRQHSDGPAEMLLVRTFRMTRAQKETLISLGGAAWLRERIDRARSVRIESPESPVPLRRGARR